MNAHSVLIHHWPRNSAAARMTEHIPLVHVSDTLGEVAAYLSRHIGKLESINYLYVVDEGKRLRGVLSIRDLYRHQQDVEVGRIAYTASLITVSPTAHQEEAAYLALQHNIKAVPVVDEAGVILGAIPNDTILAILYKELREDVLLSAGIHRGHLEYDNVLEIPFWRAFKHRIPWLVLGLLGGIVAARIVGSFEAVLSQHLVLAAFIPLVVYIADAIGTQLEAFTIRDLAMLKKFNFVRYFFRQSSLIGVIALVLGAVFAIIHVVWRGDLAIAVIVGSAIVAASCSSLLTGIIVPFVFKKIHFDPANASGPVGTIVQDMVSVALYFTIASWVL